jgi:hypothetical protein
VLPVIVIAAVAIPLLLIAFVVVRRSDAAGEHAAIDTDADRRRTEEEFEEAERYQEEWREQQHPHRPDGSE